MLKIAGLSEVLALRVTKAGNDEFVGLSELITWLNICPSPESWTIL